MGWGRAKVILGNYNNKERTMLIIMMCLYVLIVITQNSPLRWLVAGLSMGISFVYLAVMLIRSLELRRESMRFQDEELIRIGKAAYIKYMRMNSILVASPLAAICLSSIIIATSGESSFLRISFSLVSLIAFIAMIGFILNFLFLLGKTIKPD